MVAKAIMKIVKYETLAYIIGDVSLKFHEV
jgi:hypothetical protein